MKHASDTDICDGCGINKVLKKTRGNEFCHTCLTLVEILQNDPERLARLHKLSNIAPAREHKGQGETTPRNRQQELPDVLDAVRYRTRDREQNTWYVSISEMESNPVEIFASTAFDRDRHLQMRISNLTTITRLISLILRHVFLGEVLTLDKTLKQLRRSSRQKNDLPDMLSNVLSNYRKPTSKEVDRKQATS